MIVTVMEWRRVVGFDRYEVSECGDVRHVEAARTRSRGHRLRGFIDEDGYLRYSLKGPDGETHSVAAHRLVAEAFIGPAPSGRHEVAHNNGSRVSNHFLNLRWALRRENHADLQTHKTAVKGERNGRAKITEADVREIRREYVAIKRSSGRRSVTELDRRFGLNRATIINIARGKSWKHVPFDASDERATA